MSGHSKWAKIKRQKGLNDQKRGALFTKLAKNITLASSEAGGDPSMNFALRLAIDKAKSANMPSENIERAIKKGTGDGKNYNIQKVVYEARAFTAGVIIDCQTDNSNRTVSEVRKIIEQHGGKMSTPGSVSWQFSENGLIVVEPLKIKKSEKFGGNEELIPIDKEELQLELLDIDGIIDIDLEQDNGQFFLYIYTDKALFSDVLDQVEKNKLKIVSAELIKTSKENLELKNSDLEKIEKLITGLEEHEDVDAVWVNVSNLST